MTKKVKNEGGKRTKNTKRRKFVSLIKYDENRKIKDERVRE